MQIVVDPLTRSPAAGPASHGARSSVSGIWRQLHDCNAELVSSDRSASATDSR